MRGNVTESCYSVSDGQMISGDESVMPLVAFNEYAHQMAAVMGRYPNNHGDVRITVQGTAVDGYRRITLTNRLFTRVLTWQA